MDARKILDHRGIVFAAAPRRRGRPAAGFTLIELLTVVAVVAVLSAVLLPALGQCRAAARATREVSAARVLMQAYLLVPQDRRGELLPGSKNEPAYDEEGAPLGTFSYRWPHRLAPYLGKRLLDTLFLNDQARYYSDLRATVPEQASYLFSLTPSFGLNLAHVGGITLGSGALDQRYGPITRLEQCTAPARQLVFASTANRLIATDAGYFEARSPTAANWPATLDASASDASRGWVDFRHRDRAVTAWLDGHVSREGYASLRDMRLWAEPARRANEPTWHP